MSYWPAWLGAIALGGLPILVWVVERRLLGVSGSFGALMTARDREAEKLLADQAALRAELLRATLEEFGTEAAAELAAAEPAPRTTRTGLSHATHFVFLISISAGGALGAATSGEWVPRLSMGSTHAALFGSSLSSLGVLFVGGLLVGFGTRLAGGCTSGHGLSGVSRLQPGSLIATAAYFGAAVITSLFLSRLLT